MGYVCRNTFTIALCVGRVPRKLYTENARNWEEWFESAMFSCNISVHGGTKFPARELFCGYLTR
jgi:hypothetical protein